jgi:hypothetical protein
VLQGSTACGRRRYLRLSSTQRQAIRVLLMRKRVLLMRIRVLLMRIRVLLMRKRVLLMPTITGRASQRVHSGARTGMQTQSSALSKMRFDGESCGRALIRYLKPAAANAIIYSPSAVPRKQRLRNHCQMGPPTT